MMWANGAQTPSGQGMPVRTVPVCLVPTLGHTVYRVPDNSIQEKTAVRPPSGLRYPRSGDTPPSPPDGALEPAPGPGTSTKSSAFGEKMTDLTRLGFSVPEPRIDATLDTQNGRDPHGNLPAEGHRETHNVTETTRPVTSKASYPKSPSNAGLSENRPADDHTRYTAITTAVTA